ncbi:hypothetical protein K0U83_09675, partial [bacterium]|nr:hypothetical protein [bacterium]
VRYLPVVVQVAVVGKRCSDWMDPGIDAGCPFLSADWSRCRRFNVDLRRFDDEEDMGRLLRCGACLALDDRGVGEPDGLACAEKETA